MSDETTIIHHDPEPESPAESAILEKTSESAAHLEHLVTGHENLREEMQSLRAVLDELRTERGSTSSDASSIRTELAGQLRQSEERTMAAIAALQNRADDLANEAVTQVEEPPVESVHTDEPRRQKPMFWRMVLGK